MSAELSHENGWVHYLDDGTAVVRPPKHEELGIPSELRIAPHHQFPAIRATLDDLNKALSRLANSPLLDGVTTLRQRYEEELNLYEEATARAMAQGRWEPDYGNYVLDHYAGQLYLVAPEYWHRLALVTSNSKLTADAEGGLSWLQVRQKLEGTVVGFAGLSVGGNLLEGWLREARPRRVKIADPDWLELTNFNRCERASLRHLVASRAARFDPRDPYDVPRVSKAEFTAYEHQLVDPYLEFIIYKEPLSAKNARQFLAGDADGEPAVDVLVEEVDDVDVKIELREVARQHGIDVLMLTDFGHRTQVLWNPFKANPAASLGASQDDPGLRDALLHCKDGDRSRFFDFVDRLCRFDFRGDPFENFVKGEGEQPTASLPQSGSTTMIAGGLGGKELALGVLGHRRDDATHGVIFDFLRRSVSHV